MLAEDDGPESIGMRSTYRMFGTRTIAPTVARAIARRTAARVALAALTIVAMAACARSSSEPPPADHLAIGTWGAEGAAVVVGDRQVHVHLGCTKGDFVRPTTLTDGRFNVEGTYVLRAFPVQLGPALPARFTGVVRGSLLTLAVAVNDTVERQLVALGPVTIVLGREPRMGPCPICASGVAHLPRDTRGRALVRVPPPIPSS